MVLKIFEKYCASEYPHLSAMSLTLVNPCSIIVQAFWMRIVFKYSIMPVPICFLNMVACKESVRGKGYGILLGKWAVVALKKEGMETAYLTTDDWRIPAIKSYLSVGFEPDISTEDFRERWDKIKNQLGRQRDIS